MTFNVRVYGILIDDHDRILVSDEVILGDVFTKFPGGGMEYGEGTKECLKREVREELGIEIEVGKHIYTTDFFQESAFKPDDQLISIYYEMSTKDTIDTSRVHYDREEIAFELKPHADQESFRFVPLSKFSPDMLSFPIDKVVGEIVCNGYRKK
ncbi:MAG: NUDIX domain-containing protein [Chitinophagaceae bacterium]|nr:NUDIX domain-containing protein [Chitinophagaceae bacterium]